MILLIDYRERKFIDTIIKHTAQDDTCVAIVNGFKLQYKIENLEVGDFIIKEDEIQMVIERKSVQDLCSSISDGRFREQKTRITDSINDPLKVLYVIEGNKKTVKNGSQLIESSILNLMYKHSFHVLCTESEDDTFNYIVMLVKKMQNDDFNKVTNTVPVKLVSKSVKIKNNLMAIQLSAIPGISYTTAQFLANIYKSFNHLFQEYEKCEESQRELMLASLSVSARRKLGPALSKKIYNSLYLSL